MDIEHKQYDGNQQQGMGDKQVAKIGITEGVEQQKCGGDGH